MYFNFISLDGGGKDTICNHVVKSEFDDNVLITKEPGGGENAEKIRELILHPKEKISSNIKWIKDIIKTTKLHERTLFYLVKAILSYTENNLPMVEMYLFAAARNETFNNIIIPNRQLKKQIIG